MFAKKPLVLAGTFTLPLINIPLKKLTLLQIGLQIYNFLPNELNHLTTVGILIVLLQMSLKNQIVPKLRNQNSCLS